MARLISFIRFHDRYFFTGMFTLRMPISSEDVVSGKEGLKVYTFLEIVLNLFSLSFASSSVNDISYKASSSPRLAY